MPSIVSHAVVGLAAGRMMPPQNLPRRFWCFSIICSLLPDADVIGFSFGIPYAQVLGHRGFFHSLTFALILALVVMMLFFRRKRPFSTGWLSLGAFFFGVTASHGILDTFTGGGLGIAILSPFDTARYFSPVTPIRVSPIGIQAFFSEWGLAVLLNEMLWVWLPVLVMMLAVLSVRRLRRA